MQVKINEIPVGLSVINQGKHRVAVVEEERGVISDPQSALDLIITVSRECNTDRVVLSKNALDERFFDLSTGLAGEILQKFVNYQTKLAIYGDFSGYNSRPLRDFIYESNKGKQIFFVGTKEEAVARLAEGPADERNAN